MADSRLELATVVGQLRQALWQAARQGEGQEIRFEVETLELELQVVVTREATANAGLKFWVLEAGIGDKELESRVQRVKLVLKPKGKGGGSFEVAG
ncbi:MAG TPA: trypco2 family protein [Thermoanaerobaculia bacterium]|nr:trypco2 family protein [Thermoanaerobaculia bacterium]